MSAAATTKTTCPYCGVGCGVLVSRSPEGDVGVRGDPDHPANFGRLCSKGSALAETIGLEGRLLEPMLDGKPASWDAALDRVADGFSRIIREHGADAVAFYVSGQLLTEDYYVINKLAKGFVGTANIDTNSRLCMASSVAGHKRAFGSDTVPGNYEDLEEADLILFTGSNAAWCHPVLHQRIQVARENNRAMRLVVIDPRRTDTCEGADLHLALKSGSDAALFNGLLAWLNVHNVVDRAFVANHTNGAEAALAAARPFTLAATAKACGLAEADVLYFFKLFAATRKTVTLYSQGINQSSSGTDKVNAILNCHLLTGRIGQPGMGPFSLTGQPNAMGGREVGGLANQLAAHMEIDNADHRALVQGFWQSPTIATQPGRKAVDMFDAIAAGTIKAVWIMSTNPIVSLPNADRARAALERCELVVVSDCLAHTDTTRHADVLLPAAAWGEKSGTVTNSERRISRQRPFMDAPGQSRPDWLQVCQVAQKMGFSEGFNFTSPAEIFREHAALSGHGNGGTRDFDISALGTLSDAGFEELAPVQWPLVQGKGTARLFGDGQFFTPDRRARFLSITPRAPATTPTADFPLVLNTGRVRDHWHTMTRTGKSARLSSHVFEPFVSLHPHDAAAAGIADGALAQVETVFGKMLARAKVSADELPGNIAVPMHWTGEFSAQGRVNALVNPLVDPVSGQPESKHTPARVAAWQPQWQAFAMTRGAVDVPLAEYWVRGFAGTHWRTEMAGQQPAGNFEDIARRMLEADVPGTDWLAYRDARSGTYRYATIRGGRLQGCLFASPSPLPARPWLASLFGEAELPEAARQALLLGRPLVAGPDPGRTVCSCFAVGENQIIAAIRDKGCASVAAIGLALDAGTNCGSCKPELNRILNKVQAKEHALQPA